jgi:hypothetical protein
MNKPIVNQFQYLDIDAHEDFSNESSVSYALNAVKQNETSRGYGYSNERGTLICTDLPEGYKLRGYTMISERDEFILFLYNGTNSEIGAVNPNGCEYKKYVNDDELPCKFNFGFHEWITIVPKRIQPCNEIELYWSNNRVYKYFNIDNPNRHLIESCDDINLMKLNYAPTVKLHTVESGGLGILNGIYQVVVRLTDTDGNHTNWMHIGDSVKVWGGDNKAGEISPQYIDIRLSGITKHYKNVDIAIVKTIGGKTSAHLIYKQFNYNKNKASARYHSVNQEIEDISLTEIFAKSDHWIHGKGLLQKDNRLILFDIDNHWNLNYQRKADEIRVGWSGYRVKQEDAHKYPSLLGGENYLFFIVWNYFDGTVSPSYVLSNHNVSGTELVSDSCSSCEKASWESSNTATIDWTTDGYNDPFKESQSSTKTYDGYEPTTEPYKTVDEWADQHKEDAERDIEETADDAEKVFETIDKGMDAGENSDCCDASVITATERDGPKDPCVGIDCPPTCVCIDGCCYKPVSTTNPRDGSNEEYDGCGNAAEHIPDHVYEICTEPGNIPNSEYQASVAYNGCGDNNGLCPGCINCHPELYGGDINSQINEREGSVSSTYVTPANTGVGELGLCNGGIIGNGCGDQADATINNPQVTNGVTNSELTERSNPCDIDCVDGACPSGCKCHGQCNGGECDVTGAGCGKGCACVQHVRMYQKWEWKWNPFLGYKVYVPVMHSEITYVCVSDGTKPKCKQIKSDGGTDTTDTTDSGGGTTSGGGGDSQVDEEPIYDDDGCTIIGWKPVLVAKGLFGYAESKHTYPETLDCDGETKLYTNAGKPIRLFKAPTREQFPHFISYQTGVKSKLEPGNEELTNGYVQLIGFYAENIVPPEDTPKPLDKNNPFTIKYAKRDDANKTILDKGIIFGTFEGEVYGEKYMFPMNGGNSLELFNRYIKSNTKSNNVNSTRWEDHAGYISETPGYTFHSPLTQYRKSYIKGQFMRPELEINGLGYRHGLYAYGNEPSDPQPIKIGNIKEILKGNGNLNVPRENQKGTRQSIHYNKINKPLNSNGSWAEQCIKDITYVNADSITKKSKKFDRAFFNRDSESCVYMQTSGYFKLAKGIDSLLLNQGSTAPNGGKYNGDPEKNLAAQQICDASFLGDVKYHDTPIYNATLLYGGIHIRNIYQYGRLESMETKNTGIEATWDNYISQSIHGWCGDVFISPFSFTKSTYVSDRVGREVLVKDPLTFEQASNAANSVPEEGNGKNGNKAKEGARGLKRLINNITGATITWTIGLCGNPPVSGLSIGIDPRNKAGLRHWNGKNDKSPVKVYDDEHYGGYWNGVDSFNGYIPPSSDGSFRRCYYPGVVKTEHITWVESEIAVPLRQTGEEEDKEINYFNTKSHGVDSSFSGGIGWKDKYLNRFYMLLKEVSLYQKIFMTLTILLGKIIIPAFLLVQIGGYIKGGGGIFGTVLSLVFQIIAILIVVALIILLWITIKTFASEYLVTFFGLKQCYNDAQGGPGDSLKRDFHDNYFGYNWDYSLGNELDPGFAPPANYNTCKCVAEPSNKIIYSNPQIIDAPNNSWRNFKVNNILTMGTEFGKITHVSIVNNNLWAYTTDMIWNLRSGEVSLESTEEVIVLGRGDYINQAYPLYGNIKEGYAGLKYPNSLISTEIGDIYIDHESGRVYKFTGNIEEIGTQGVAQFMRENCRFKTESDHIDEKCDDGIGYALGYDREYRRILITKRDGEYSWTLSYSLEENKWVSFHSYIPHLYMYDRWGIFTEHEGKIWRFNKGDKYQTYFDNYYPFVLEFNTKIDSHTPFQHKHTSLNTEAIRYSNIPNVPIRDLNITFNKGIFMNTNQSTGIQNFIINDGLDLNSAMVQSPTKMNISRQGINWRYSDIMDHVIDKDQPIYMLDQTYRKLPVNNFGDNKHDFQYNRFLTQQFILDNHDDIELIAKNAITLVNIPSE